MDLDFWWLLLVPVVFGLGWIAARFDLRHLLSERASLPSSYFKGLNFLLNEQPDKAIDAFIEVAKLDPETTELHFALGNLFRKRGETERAIRVHQNVFSRTDLPKKERDHALYELAQDFLKAGLLDRAETAFKTFIAPGYASQRYADEAQQCLLTIYSLEKEWPEAIVCAQQLEARGVGSYKKEIAQFYCEQAQEAFDTQKEAVARKALAKALAAYPLNPRALLLLGDADMMAGKADIALKTWAQIEKQNVIYLPLVIERLMRAYTLLNQVQKGIEALIETLEQHPSNDLFEAMYPYVVQHQGVDRAYALAHSIMQKLPTMSAAMALLEAHSIKAGEPQRSEIDWIRRLIMQRIQNKPRYLCQECGFRARLFYWQCPGCQGWESLKADAGA